VSSTDQQGGLEARFGHFVESLPNAEVIDRLELPSDPTRRRKADYLLGGRSVIVELKTLSDDVSHKVEAMANRHRERDDWPLFYGTADVRKVLAHLTGGEAIYGKLVNALGRSVEDAVRSAEEQITHTKGVLGIPDAAGMLVILNEAVGILDPYVVGHRVAQLLRRPRTGNSESEKLNFVWLLFESHAMGKVAGIPAAPSLLIRGDGASSFPWFDAFHKDVVRRWAEWNGGIAFDGNAHDPSKIHFSSMKDVREPAPTRIPRHELWRRQYRANPYLRALSDEGVLARGADIMRRLMPHFIKEGPGYVPEAVNPLMEEFTHFQEEASFRALDLRDMPMSGGT
jgi:hypothetical protein